MFLAVRDSARRAPVVPRRVDAADRSRRRQHEPDAAAPRSSRTDPASMRSAPSGFDSSSTCAGYSHDVQLALLQAVHRERHRGNPARDSAQARHPYHRDRRRRPLRGGADSRRAEADGRSREIAARRVPGVLRRGRAARRGQLVERFRLPAVEAETLVPALLVYRTLLSETAARAAGGVRRVAADRACCSTSPTRADGSSAEDFERQVLASAEALGQRYRFDRAARPSRRDARRRGCSTSSRTSTAWAIASGCCCRSPRCCTTSASTSACARITSTRSTFWRRRRSSACPTRRRRSSSNIARYHRRGLPQRSTCPYVALDRRGSADRQQAGGDPARGQRARRRTRCRRSATLRAVRHVEHVDRSSSRGRATSRWSGWRRRRVPTCSPRRSAAPLRDPAAGRRVMTGDGHRRRLFINRELSWLAFNERVLDGGARSDRRRCSSGSSSPPSRRRTSTSSSWSASRPAARERDGETAVDLAGLTPHRSNSRPSRPRSMRWSTLSTACVKSRAAAGARRASRSSCCRGRICEPLRSSRLSAYFRDAILPVLTPLAIDASRPFPLLASLSLNLALLLDAPRRTRPTAPRDRAGARRSARGSSRSPARNGLSSCPPRRARPGAPRAAVSRPDDSRVGGRSAWRETPSSSSTTKAAARTWRSSSARCGGAAAATSFGWSWRPARRRNCQALLRERLELERVETSIWSTGRSIFACLMPLADLPGLDGLRVSAAAAGRRAGRRRPDRPVHGRSTSATSCCTIPTTPTIRSSR